jgi:hypothetical protein
MLVPEPQTGAFTNVVTCVDFLGTSRAAVEQGVRVAVRDRARLHLLHVFMHPLGTFISDAGLVLCFDAKSRRGPGLWDGFSPPKAGAVD